MISEMLLLIARVRQVLSLFYEEEDKDKSDEILEEIFKIKKSIKLIMENLKC
jgi:hypothetical protein